MVDQVQKENLGIVVQYKVKVRLILGFASRLVMPSWQSLMSVFHIYIDDSLQQFPIWLAEMKFC